MNTDISLKGFTKLGFLIIFLFISLTLFLHSKQWVMAQDGSNPADPTDELLPNTTNKAYKVSSITTDSPMQATTGFSSTDYNNINTSNNVYVTTEAKTTISDSTACYLTDSSGSCGAGGNPCTYPEELCYGTDTGCSAGCEARGNATLSSSTCEPSYGDCKLCQPDNTCPSSITCGKIGTCTYTCNAGYYDCDNDATNGCESGSPCYIYTFQRFTFNLSAYNISDVTEIKYCFEGYYTNDTTAGIQANLLYYNVTSASWVTDQNINYNSDQIKCKSFTGNEITDVYNSTSKLFQFAARGRIGRVGKTLTLYADFVNLSVSYVTALGWLNVTLLTPDPSACTDSNPCNWQQRNTYWINATVECEDGPCGNVEGIVRYNASSTNPDTGINTTTGATPFYNTSGSNPQSCGPMNQGDTCQLNWTVNVTGVYNSYWKIDVNFNSSISDISSNDTDDAIIRIFVYGWLDVTLFIPSANKQTYWIQNNTYSIQAGVECKDGDCGDVNGTVRYAASPNEPDTLINTTTGATPFYIVEALYKPVSWEENESAGTLNNPENAYDDGFNDTSTKADIDASTFAGTEVESLVYNWDYIEANATLFYTWSTSVAGDLSVISIEFFNWGTGGWDVERSITSGESTEVRTLEINSTYINSAGGFRAMFKSLASDPTGDAYALIDLYDIHVLVNHNLTLSPDIDTIPCGNMNVGNTCRLGWTVNTTGNINTYWKIDVLFNSSSLNVSSNDTDNAIIKIVLALNVHVQGTALYYYTGERVNGDVMIIPVETPEDTDTSSVINGEWSTDFYIDPDSVQYLTIIIDDDQKIGYNELKLDNDVTASLTCSVQDISISGYSVDLNSGNSITSGNVTVSVLDTDYTNTTSFPGTWSIDFHPCLIPGKIYTLQILVSDDTGKKGEILQKYPAR